ncbi:MAG: PadR family transcriptional regulator [Acidobacteriota bacterium]
MTGRKAELGELETLVMLAALRLQGRGSVRQIREEVATRGERSISRGAMYATVSRLEKKGLLRRGAHEVGAGGQQLQPFEVTGEGLARLRATHRRLRRMRSGLESILDAES